ncbi:aldehyde dehydrogenase family protein [Streptomyces sp. NPDC001508]|uniref:aldehyde dehydrogenase family protein n=1 Tax=Streptomyces sp. NPDC001508 TaxID=3154656 RepID=UPI00332D1BC6
MELTETSPAERAAVLNAIGDELTAAAGELIPQARAETGLAEARLAGELKRTVVQLRMFADVCAEGEFLDVRIDDADPEFVLGPRPDLRRFNLPVGPVLVFAASNFPFAFSVAGGDTASALAAGCPVILKAHPGRPRLSALTAEKVRSALVRAGRPVETFEVVFASCRIHVLDLKQKNPGYVLDSTDMYQEGMFFPGSRLYRAGTPNQEIFDIIRFNSRMPERTIGDLQAQVSACVTGVRRTQELAAKHGADVLVSAMGSINDHGERLARLGLARLPRGTWSATDIVDSDGVDTDRHSVAGGVRSIEHGNLLDDDTATAMAAARAFLVPTLVAYDAMARRWQEAALSPVQRAKNAEVLDFGLRAVQRAQAAGVRVGFGTDLMADLEDDQLRGLELQAEAIGWRAALRSATRVNADLVGRPDLGRVEVGATADLLLLDGPLTDDETLLWDGTRNRTVIQGGVPK